MFFDKFIGIDWSGDKNSFQKGISVAECSSGNLVPQIEENIDLAIWKFPEEIPKLMKNAYENIKLLINKLD